MKHPTRNVALVGLLSLSLGSAAIFGTLQADAAHAAGDVTGRPPVAGGWLVRSLSELQSSHLPTDDGGELDQVRALAANRTESDVERVRWWNVGGPAYRWNQLAVEEMLGAFITTLPATRGLTLLHTAIDDAVAAAWEEKRKVNRPRSNEADPSITTAIPVPDGSSYPSDHAAAAAAAAGVLGHLFPDAAAAFDDMAEEALQSRVLAGVEYPSDAAAGRSIGEQAAALAIERGKTDGSDAKWAGSVPAGDGKWQGTDPIAPLAGTWRPWVLDRADEFRPPAPPAFDSAATKLALAELKQFERTPASNHRAVYWEVF